MDSQENIIRITALKESIQSGDKTYPLFLALLPADQVSQIAAVPNYQDSTTNVDIARNVSLVPVKEWQRPPIPTKITLIRQLYDNRGEFMPNPVLIGENPYTNDPPEVRQLLVAGNTSPVWEILIRPVQEDAKKPLWILDGQHRIAGLAESAQSSNPVPVVFLLNQGDYYYGADTLAQIFAQVTTSATPLDKLHREWLSYAFHLNHYSAQEVRAKEQRKAMSAVISLCKTASFGDKVNPFYDRIQYNDRLPASKMLPGGHVYSCIELKEIILRDYFAAQKSQQELSPEAVAKEMCFARLALASVIKTPPEQSVFFGDDVHHQKIMEDAFWPGTLRYLAVHGIPSSWREVLRMLHFDTTDWDFSWTVTLHGIDQTRSKKLAKKVMEAIFHDRSLPSGNNNIHDLLRGNGAQFELEAFNVTPNGYPSNRGTKNQVFRRGDTTSFPIETRKGIRLRQPSLNVQDIRVTDKQAPPGTLVEYKEVNKSGLRLHKELHKNPLELLFTLRHYGGVSSSVDVRIDWNA